MIPNQWYVVLNSKEVKDKHLGVTRMGEKLIQGDHPILHYRRRRYELLQQAGAVG